MHEMSIAHNILEIVDEHVPRKDGGPAKVKVVRIRVGDMAGVVPESLRFCFDVASQGTVAEGAKLDIEKVATRCACPNCKSEFEVERYAFVCSTCQSPNIELVSGNELDVVELEVSEEN